MRPINRLIQTIKSKNKMSAAKELLSKLKRPEKVVVPTVYFPPLFISIEAAIKMKEED